MKPDKGHSSLPDCHRFSLVTDRSSLSLGNMAKLGSLTGLYLAGIGGNNELMIMINNDNNEMMIMIIMR